MPGLASLALAASMSSPLRPRRLVLGSDHNGGMSRHSDLMIARARLRWLGEVRQMSAIGTPRATSGGKRTTAFYSTGDGRDHGDELLQRAMGLNRSRGSWWRPLK